MKAYTDIEQSKKLVEILSLDTADGYWFRGFPFQPYMVYTKGIYNPGGEHIPCWSLAALLDVLPEYNLQRTDWENKTEYKIVVTADEDNYASKNYDNPIDACYKIITYLHELKLL